MKPIVRSLVCLSILAGFSSALAQDGMMKKDGVRPAARTPRGIIKKYDQDKDRQLSPVEFRELSRVRYLFRQLDADRSGFIQEEELAARGGNALEESGLVYLVQLSERAQTFEVVDHDRNRDGRLAQKEYFEYLFRLSDQNGDGFIDEAEADFLAYSGSFTGEFGGKGYRVMKKFDRSDDGRISLAEFQPARRVFEMRDRDGDGQLDAEELLRRETRGLAAFANQDVDSLMEKYDRDGDGKLSASELPGGTRSVLKGADRDDDSAVSRKELRDALARVQGNQFAYIDSAFLERFDLNDDRRVTRKEFPGNRPLFERLDRNGDGVINKADG